MSWVRTIAIIALGGLFAACGSVSRNEDDASPPDASLPDADLPDAAPPDAPPPQPPTPARETLSGAARVSGPTFSFDVSVGQPVGQQPMTGPTTTLQGNTAVKP